MDDRNRIAWTQRNGFANCELNSSVLLLKDVGTVDPQIVHLQYDDL